MRYLTNAIVLYDAENMEDRIADTFDIFVEFARRVIINHRRTVDEIVIEKPNARYEVREGGKLVLACVEVLKEKDMFDVLDLLKIKYKGEKYSFSLIC